MAYNKAKAEKEWLRWKEVEEKKLENSVWMRKPSNAAYIRLGSV